MSYTMEVLSVDELRRALCVLVGSKQHKLVRMVQAELNRRVQVEKDEELELRRATLREAREIALELHV